MIKRAFIQRLIDEQKAEEVKHAAPIKEKLAELTQAVTGLLAGTPEDLWSLDELGIALKPSGVICRTVKKFASPEETADTGCHGCQSHECHDECRPECQCEGSSELCDLCGNFLMQALQFLGSQEIVEIFGFQNQMYVGLHR